MSTLDPNSMPKKAEGLEVNELPDGYVIYQPATDRVHYLNRTAVVVFEICDGTVPVSAIPDLVQKAYDLPDVPTSEVHECLERLVGEGLLQQAAEQATL